VDAAAASAPDPAAVAARTAVDLGIDLTAVSRSHGGTAVLPPDTLQETLQVGAEKLAEKSSSRRSANGRDPWHYQNLTE